MAGSTTYIYGLTDPRTQQLRYVGKSHNPTKRKRGHLKDPARTHKACWIRSLLKEDLAPEVIILEEVHRASWEDAEKWWIAYFRSIGADLTNATSGGEGLRDPSPETLAKMFGHYVSPETKEKIRQKAIGRPSSRKGIALTDVTKAKLKLAGQARRHSEETKAKMSATRTGKKHSPETRANIGAGNIGKHSGKICSEETRRKISEACKGHLVSEQHREIIRKTHTGKFVSEATREKLRQANLGKTLSEEHKAKLRNVVVSPETRAKISAGNKGKVLSEEQKTRLREANVGRTRSEEVKENMRKGNAEAKARRDALGIKKKAPSPEAVAIRVASYKATVAKRKALKEQLNGR